MQKVNSNILWLPSWYPSKVDSFNGDFIQRHAIALSQFKPVHVVYIVKDKLQAITNSVKIESNEYGNLKETIIYYATPNYLPTVIESIYSYWKCRRIYRQYFNLYFEKNELPSVVHVHVAFKAGMIALWLKRKFRVNYFVSEHWSGYSKLKQDNFYNASWIFRYWVKKILKLGKRIIPVSQNLGEQIKFIVPDIRLQIIPNVVSDKFFQLSNIGNQQFSFIHCTSKDLVAKNTMGLLRVFAELCKKRQDWECIIYGPANRELIDFVIKTKIEQYVRFTGEISYHQVAELMQTASVFISFSKYENQPCSILEALCCGVPIIATKVGGVPEIVNQQNGILIDANDEVQLLQAVQVMLNEHKKFERKIIANDAQQKYYYPVIGKQLSELYSQE